ncbi:MAG: efflux RND transporter permease subunit, partial [Bacteroidota bacterium]
IWTQPFLHGLLISPTDSSTLMIISVDETFNDTPARVDLVEQIREDLEAIPAPSAMAGFPYLRTHYATRVSAEAPLFTLLALLVSLFLLYLTFRSWRAVLLPAVIVLLGIVWTVGLVSLFGHRLNIVLAILPALLVIIGMANGIHLTTKFFDKYELLNDRRGALLEMLRTAGLATFLTSLTTAIGFFVLNLSGSALLAVFGTFAAVGIMFLYLLSISLIPIAYDRARAPSHAVASLATHDVFAAIFDRVAIFTERRSASVLIATGLLVIAGGIGASQISSDIFVFSDFSSDDPLRQELSTFEAGFGGILPMEVIIEADRDGAFRNPAHLRRIERLQNELIEMEPIGRAHSAADLLKLATQSYFGGHPANFRLPTSYEMPFLESAVGRLFEADDRGGVLQGLPQMVDSSFSMARIYLGVDDIGTEAMNVLADSVASMTSAALPADRFDVFVTGTAIMATRSGQNLVRNLVVSLIAALIIISVLMAVLFRSARLTFISIIPNVIPLLLVGAVMGYFGIALKPSTALIFSLAFGIAVDDTIHFLAKYRILKHDGMTKAAAIRVTLSETGKAILFTSLVLMGGFLIFTLSDFGGTASMGALTAFTLGAALLSNLLVLPALLYRYAPEHSQVDVANSSASETASVEA